MAPIKSLVLLGLAAGCALVNGQWAAQRMRPYRDPSGCSEVERVDPNSACFNGGAAPLSPSGQGEAMPVNKIKRGSSQCLDCNLPVMNSEGGEGAEQAGLHL